ncbi:helix-turn-helix transcriptional regulator [Sphingobacterium oryzagri]|uniref:Helix-turn-helix transcriptional regulator n=1 Tax=Sphingobacterium oryzagri TaxID=3025669 RepID=A0ABY7WLY5_9SPHI|nr:helix-turn-helix domain-containing protein [Sphingobacterium sp. KACC 22765]WDF70020.1 helix-turn-helix transcriptional regulator [Sphingobacterium sp. KACC 22765]
MKKQRVYPNQFSDFPTLAMDRFTPVDSGNSPLLFHLLRGEQHIESAHKHDFFIIMLVKKGSGVHSVDFTDYTVRKNQLHVVLSHQVHQWHFSGDSLIYQLMLSRKLFAQLSPWYRLPISHQQQRAVFDIPEKLVDTLVHEFQAIQDELQLKPTYDELIYLRCQIIGLTMSRFMEHEEKEHNNIQRHPVVSKFIQLVEDNYRTARAVSFYAAKLHISANYLNVLCKKYTAWSASKIIQDRILLEAKRLLKISDRSAKQIAYDLGFYDHASFSNFFKSQTGVSPIDFRRQT